MIIAVDHGNARIKTVHHSFISGVTEHSVRPPLAEDLVEYNGHIWTLSGQRIPYMRDKTRNDKFFILTLFAIAKELESMGSKSPLVQITLAVGLPPEHYGALKTKFADYFKRGPVKFCYNDKLYTLVIENVFVYPQAYGAVVPNNGVLKGHSRTFAVDIGGYTTDVLLFRQTHPDLQFCRSLELGIITMVNQVAGKVNSQYDLSIDDEHIADVLQGRDSVLPKEVQEAIRKEVGSHAERILDSLRELGVDLRSNPAIFIGGGALLLRPFIENSSMVIKPEFVSELNANAIGYEMLASRQLQKQIMQSEEMNNENNK